MSLNHRLNKLEKNKGSCGFMLVIVEKGEDAELVIQRELTESGLERDEVGYMLIIHHELRPQDDHHDS